MVQCGSCGNKWKQYPVGEVKKTQSISSPKKVIAEPRTFQQKKFKKPKKNKKNCLKKTKGN